MDIFLEVPKGFDDLGSKLYILSRNSVLKYVAPMNSQRVDVSHQKFFIPGVLNFFAGLIRATVTSADGLPRECMDVFFINYELSLRTSSNNSSDEMGFDMVSDSVSKALNCIITEISGLLQSINITSFFGCVSCPRKMEFTYILHLQKMSFHFHLQRVSLLQ